MTEQSRLETLEFKLAHLEHAMQQISDVVAKQQVQLDAALARGQRLASRIEELEGSAGATNATAFEPPPHY